MSLLVYLLKLNDLQQQLEEAVSIPKATVDILKDQVFGFDTFFVTSHEPYEVSIQTRHSKGSSFRFIFMFIQKILLLIPVKYQSD